MGAVSTDNSSNVPAYGVTAETNTAPGGRFRVRLVEEQASLERGEAVSAISRPHDFGFAPLTGWKRALTDWATVGSATAATHVLGAATSILLRMALTPTQMGIWQALKLLTSYGNYAGLGASKAAARQLSIARGSGHTTAAQRDLNLAFAVNTLSSLAYATVLFVAGLYIGASSGGSAAWGMGLAAVGLLSVIARYTTFHITILRASQAFGATSRIAVVEAVLTLGLCPAAAWAFGLIGLYTATLLVLLGTIAVIGRCRAAELRWAWDRSRIGQLIAIGAPILLAGTVASLFRSLDKWMILAYLDDAAFQLGCYSVALMVGAQLYGTGNMLAMVMAPRYGELYGRVGNRRPVALLAARSTELQSAALALPAAAAIVVAPSALSWLLPAYRPGLAAVAWLVLGTTALVAALPATQYLVAVGRQKRALRVVMVSLLISGLLNHVALRAGGGIGGVALATALGYLIYLALAFAESLWPELQPAQRTRYLLALLASQGLIVGGTIALVRFWPSLSFAALGAKLLVVGLGWSAVMGCGLVFGKWNRQFWAADA